MKLKIYFNLYLLKKHAWFLKLHNDGNYLCCYFDMKES